LLDKSQPYQQSIELMRVLSALDYVALVVEFDGVRVFVVELVAIVRPALESDACLATGRGCVVGRETESIARNRGRLVVVQGITCRYGRPASRSFKVLPLGAVVDPVLAGARRLLAAKAHQRHLGRWSIGSAIRKAKCSGETDDAMRVRTDDFSLVINGQRCPRTHEEALGGSGCRTAPGRGC